MSLYWQYFRAGGGYLSAFFLMINFIVTQILFSGSEYWLTLWTNAEELRGRLNSTNFTNSTVTTLYGLNLIDLDTYTGIYVFSGLIGGVFFFSMLRTVHFFLTCLGSSIDLHNNMFRAVMRSPIQFFNKNPAGISQAEYINLLDNFNHADFSYLFLGRILNRFTKDMGCLDEMLPARFFDVLSASSKSPSCVLRFKRNKV